MIRIRVPASTSNLGAGFDALGLALGLYLTLEIEGTAEPFGSFAFEGEGAEELRSAAHENLVFQTMRLLASREDVELKPARIAINNEIPLARGLGSSGAAIVAGITAFEVLSGVALTPERILAYAAEIEGHSDNVSAALLGGFVVSCMTGDGKVLAGKIDWPSEIRAVAVIPDFMLRTHDARAAIPETVLHRDAVFNLQRSSLMVAAIASGQPHLIREAMRDRLHQPYRAALVPGLQDVLDIMADSDESLGSLDEFLGLALSGSGPTVLALATGDYHEIASEISSRFERHQIRCKSDVLSIELHGRAVEEID